jgi:hypothetical protein
LGDGGTDPVVPNAIFPVVDHNPTILTLFNRFLLISIQILYLNVAKALLCGNSISIPYILFNRYGYLSGSINCSLRYVKTGDSRSCTSLSI